MIKTPEFQGTHLWERLHWAKDNLEKVQSDIRVVYEDPEDMDNPAKILVPDPNWMACALQGGILPPVEVYWELAKDEAQPDFEKHTRGEHGMRATNQRWLYAEHINCLNIVNGEMHGK
jgi:hypothetical protein